MQRSVGRHTRGGRQHADTGTDARGGRPSSPHRPALPNPPAPRAPHRRPPSRCAAVCHEHGVPVACVGTTGAGACALRVLPDTDRGVTELVPGGRGLDYLVGRPADVRLAAECFRASPWTAGACGGTGGASVVRSPRRLSRRRGARVCHLRRAQSSYPSLYGVRRRLRSAEAAAIRGVARARWRYGGRHAD